MTPRRRAEASGELGGLVRWTLLPTAVFLGVVLTGYGVTGHDLTVILQDRFPEDSEWSGLLTILFGSALMVAAGVALGGALLTRGAHRAAVGADDDPARRAGLAIALLAVVIGFDDMMMIHDAVLPGSGMPEDAGLGVYGLVGIGLAAWALGPLRRAGLAPVFLTAMALLAGSIGGDVLEDLLEGRSPAFAAATGHGEDVVKFLAYAALCHLCVRLARRRATGAGSAAGPPVGPDAVTAPVLVYGVVVGGPSTPAPTAQATPVPARPQ